jgi:hypothetical protein
MFRAVVPILLLLVLTSPAPAQHHGYFMPWPHRLQPRQTVHDILEELAAPEVSGAELAAAAQVVLERWRDHMEERERIAKPLAELAAALEKDEEFVKALAVYESLWLEFPERQDLIGTIKREHALADLDIDVSTPQKTLLSIKRALLTYKLTAPTFGITDLDTPIYELGPVERHESPDRKAYLKEHQWQLAEAEDAATSPAERGPAPVVPGCIAVQFLVDLEKPITIDLKNAPFPDALARVGELSGIPLVVSQEAKSNLTNRPVTMHLENVPVKDVLKYTLRFRNLRYIRRHFSLLIVPIDHSTEQYATLVMQQEPVDHFPGYGGVASREFPVGDPSSFLGFSGQENAPAGWFVRIAEAYYASVITAPADVVGLWCSGYCTAETGRYYGRVMPLFRCFRRYPLPGPWVSRHDGHPKKRYIFSVQLARQVQAMQAFLDDREAIASLLDAELEAVEQHEPNRFIPRFAPREEFPIAARLGVWFDGEAHRLLLFDSEEDRERWLKGEDWVDVPSDLDDYDWPSEEEWQRTLDEEEREFKRLQEQSE